MELTGWKVWLFTSAKLSSRNLPHTVDKTAVSSETIPLKKTVWTSAPKKVQPNHVPSS